MKKFKVALVLGSGGARGLAHIGVIKLLEKLNLKIDCVIGTSMGAFIGGFFCKGFNANEMEKIALSFDKISTLKILSPSFSRFGIIDTEKIKRFLNQFIENVNIEDLPIPFFAITTDLVTGKEVVLNKGNLVDAIISSIAVPVLIKPYYYKNRYFVDGGLVNPLPTSIAYSLKSELIIAVNVTIGPHRIRVTKQNSAPTFEKLRKKLQSELSSWRIRNFIPENLMSSILQENPAKKEPEFPKTIQTLLQSLSIMENRLINLYLQFYPPDILITPKIKSFTMLEFYRAEEIIEAGYKSAVSKASEIKRLYKQVFLS